MPRDSARLRILAITLASGLSGALLYSHTEGQIAGQPVWLITGGLYAAMIGLCAVVIFRFFPRFGPFLGYTSATRLMLATTCALAPEVAATVTGAPLLNATLIVGGALALQAMVGPPRRSRGIYPARRKLTPGSRPFTGRRTSRPSE
ncbi:MAG: hypothetical protein R3D80_15385 [Paracoccaceae bacterium]